LRTEAAFYDGNFTLGGLTLYGVFHRMPLKFPVPDMG
jgi:hypothetical protein